MTYNPSAQAGTPQIFSAVDNTTGLPLAGGLLFTYASGTLTPQATYTDNTLTTQCANPIILDNYGQAIFWLGSENYRFNLLNSLGVQQAHYPMDNIQPISVGNLSTQLEGTTTTSQGAGLVGYNNSLTYPVNTVGAGISSVATSINNLASSTGANSIGFKQPITGSILRTAQTKLAESVSVKDFGAIGDGTSHPLSGVLTYNGQNTTGWSLGQWQTVLPAITSLNNQIDWVALQLAMNAMCAGSFRQLNVIPGTYLIDQQIISGWSPSTLRFQGLCGFDGSASIINGTASTIIEYVGASTPGLAMLYFNAASGIIWDGITLNCNHLLGYGIIFSSTGLTTGFVHNTVQNCGIYYAQRDGILIGDEGVPVAQSVQIPPGSRQAYANKFLHLHFFGCQRSGVHINEWNADMPLYEECWFFPDDTNTWNCSNAIWHERGGNSGLMISCESGCAVYNSATTSAYWTTPSGAPAYEGSGKFFKNGSSDVLSGSMSYQTGCDGVTMLNCWSEENGGLMWANTIGALEPAGGTGTNPYVFINTKAYGSSTGTGTDGTGQTVQFVSKSTYTQRLFFHGCILMGDVKNGSSSQSVFIYDEHNTWGSGLGIVDPAGNRTILGYYSAPVQISGGVTIPSNAKYYKAVLTGNVTVLYPPHCDVDDEIVIILTQPSGYTFGVTWTGSAWNNPSAIPAMNTGAQASTAWTFRFNGATFDCIAKL